MSMRIHRFVCVALLSAMPIVVAGQAITNVPAADGPKVGAQNGEELRIAVRQYEADDIADVEILKLFERVAEKGDARATMWIARFYNLGRCSLPQRPEIAQKMAKDVIVEISKLAEKGDVEAQFLLGAAYHQGLGVEPDLEKAVKWYTRSADAGQPTANYNLGVMLARGHGTEPDIKMARLRISRAMEAGLKLAARKMPVFEDSDRDDKERWKALRTVPLVQAVGMQKDRGIAFLKDSSLISDPKKFRGIDLQGEKQLRFESDGIVLTVDFNGRITNVEGHAKASGNMQQFRGGIPLGLSWDATARSTRQALGAPDDSGDVASDEAYGMAFHAENLCFAVMFFLEDETKLKVWRVYERWVVKYPDQPAR